MIDCPPKQFLDCLSYYDLVAIIISFFATQFITYKCFQNLNHLFQQRKDSDQQYKNSTNRKIIVNIVQISCLVVLTIQFIMAISLFVLYITDRQMFLEYGLNKWYRFIQVTFINLLNCLNITVGFLYWKAIRGYYVKCQYTIPWMFSSVVQICFWMIYLINICVIVVLSIFVSLSQKQLQTSQNIIKVSLIILFEVIVSIVICLYCRVYYYLKILCNFRMSESALKKQRIFSMVILISGILRVILSIADSTFDLYDDFGRKIDENSCLDSYPFRALIILAKNLLINLTPPFIFSQIFTTLSQQMKSQSSSRKCKSNENMLVQ